MRLRPIASRLLVAAALLMISTLSEAGGPHPRPSRDAGSAATQAGSTDSTGDPSTADSPSAASPRFRLFEPVAGGARVTVLNIDRNLVAQLRDREQRFVVNDFPLGGGELIDLQLEAFRVTSEKTRFVLGRKDAPDVPLALNPSEFAFFHGTVAGYSGSDVFIALSPTLSTAHISLGPGRPTYRLSSQSQGGRPAAAGQVFLFRAGGSAKGIDVPLCGLGDGPARLSGLRAAVMESAGSAATAIPVKGVRTIELAVDTDYEFFQLFNDVDAASAYVTALIGAVSQIYIRDVGYRFELTYVRIWDTPADLYNQPNGFDAFDAFRNHWETAQAGVQRDAAQLISGRRDLPFGGVAYLNAICSSFGYSMVGYMIGFFPDPDTISVYHYDIEVSAHELGHNCGTVHTDGYSPPIDRCYPPPTIPQRGTIMSYCSQGVSGGNAVHEMRFHKRVQDQMRSFLSGVSCLIADCNMNNVADDADISGVTSADVNANGVPDECEDCDGDGTLDPAEIAAGAADLNANGIPDDCEPDCNGNGVPDDRDILLGTSTDAYGNNIPDDCEADCNNNSISDFTEIQADLTIDINRNAIIDACEDCDGDGTTDAVALAGSHNLWIASDWLDVVGEYHADTGVLVKNAASGWLDDPQDVAVTADGRILVSSAFDSRVVEFDRSGAYVGDFVTAGSGGLVFPTGLLLEPGGDLLVSNSNGNSVLRYDGTSGAFLGAFVSAGSGGLIGPFGLAFGPNGNLFVTGRDNQVREYDGNSGAFIRVFVQSSDNGGLLNPRGMAFKPDGNLIVAGFSSDAVHEYDGTTGAYVGVFHNGGTVYGPWGVRVAPNGNIFVTRDYEGLVDSRDADHPGIEPLHRTTTRIYEYDPWTGNHLRSYLLGDDTGLFSPTGFAFMPGDGFDCNVNFVPDNCDGLPAAGSGLDQNAASRLCGCLPSASPVAEVLGSAGGPVNTKNRFLSIHAAESRRQQAIRVTYVSLPAPYDAWNGQTYFVGQPRQVCENSGQGFNVSPPDCGPAPGLSQRWFWAAPLVCDSTSAHLADWSEVTAYCTGSGEPCTSDAGCAQGTCGVDDAIHLYGRGIVPSKLQLGGGALDAPSLYDVQFIDANCALEVETNYSVPLTLTQAAWGDIVKDVTQCPNDVANLNIDVLGDVTSLVTKFANLACAPTKARADLEPCTIDMKINFTDVLQSLAAFKGGNYPFAPAAPTPCESVGCSN